MPCRINLRRDQSISLRQKYSSDKVTIFAPSWVKEGLRILGEHLDGISFDLYENILSVQKSVEPVESFVVTKDFNGQSLKLLQKIARNEALNVTGIINANLYSGIADGRILYSIRDLVRQCIVVGVDECCRCGGYNSSTEKQNRERVYLCDLAALQFQQPYNTGRLVLIQEKESHHQGLLDDLIYEKVVGERKKTYEEVKSCWGTVTNTIKNRYLQHDGFGLPGRKSCFIDTLAYSSFVKLDVILCGIAVCKIVNAHHPNDKINFKFLKYGTGFFAWKFAAELDKLILSAVLDGLETLFKQQEILKIIKCVELPFYKSDPPSAKRMEQLKASYGIDIVLGCNDALKQHPEEGIFVATTNCGDNHAVCGNEMGFSSVDAAIAENLESRGNIFSANINLLMTEEYIDV